MVSKVFVDIAAVADRYRGNARAVIDYCLSQKRLMDRARGASDYSPDEWLAIGAFLSPDFQRVGNFKEVMDARAMIAFLQAWAPTTHWEGSFKRLTESGNLVLLELEERVGTGAQQQAVNSLTVYEFDEAGKIRHLDVYLQAAPGAAEKGEAYAAAG